MISGNRRASKIDIVLSVVTDRERVGSTYYNLLYFWISRSRVVTTCMQCISMLAAYVPTMYVVEVEMVGCRWSLVVVAAH